MICWYNAYVHGSVLKIKLLHTCCNPSTPVEILGMNSSAFAGDDFIVVDSEEKAKEINSYRIEESKSKKKSTRRIDLRRMN